MALVDDEIFIRLKKWTEEGYVNKTVSECFFGSRMFSIEILASAHVDNLNSILLIWTVRRTTTTAQEALCPPTHRQINNEVSGF